MSIDAPEPRSAAGEGREMLQAQVENAPAIFAANKEYGPQYADLINEIARGSLLGHDGKPGMLDTAKMALPYLANLQATGNTMGREADVADVERLAPRTTEALLNANPRQARLMNLLNDQAAGELELGDKLDPATQRRLEQAVRSGLSVRGMNMGPAAVIREALQNYAGGEEMKARRRGFASSVVGMNQQVTGDPFLAILGRSSGTGGMASGLAGQQQGMYGQTGVQQQFNPYNAYASDLFNTNYNAQAAADIATGNANAGLWAAGIKAVGSLAGGAAAGCWIARAAFGQASPEWVAFRDHMLFDSPTWFRNAYLRHGERAATWLNRLPFLKPAVRWLMRRQLAAPSVHRSPLTVH